MPRGNKHKYLPRIPELGLENDKLYANGDIAKKLWALGFRAEGVSLHSIQESLSRAGKAHGMGGRTGEFPGWRWKQLAREYFENWAEEEAEFHTTAFAETEADTESPKRNRMVPMWIDLAAAIFLGLLMRHQAAMVPNLEPLPYTAMDLEREWFVSSGNRRHACFYALENNRRPVWVNHMP